MLALTGCNANKGEESSEEEKIPESLVVNLANVGDFEISGSTYASKAFDFTLEEKYTFTANTDFGRSAHRDGEQNWYNDNGVLQFRKNGDAATVVSKVAYPAKKVVFDVVATYNTQAEAYYPMVKAGAEADSLDFTGVTCEQSGTLNGVEIAGAKQGAGEGYQVYSYSYTFNLPEGTQFISFGASANGALNLRSVTISK